MSGRREVLTDDFRRAARQPGPAVFAVAAGLLAGLLIGLFTGRAEPGREPAVVAADEASRPSTGGPLVSAQAEREQQSLLRKALEAGVRDARRLGGEAETAVWVQGWREPVIVGARDQPMPLWSVHKPVIAIAALERLRKSGREVPSGALDAAMIDSIQRSDNCAARRVTLGLQELAGGEDEARASFVATLRAAGANVAAPRQATPALPHCRPYLEQHPGVSIDARAPLFGTAEWTIEDAIAFTHALATNEYGVSGQQVRDLMRRPKLRSQEQGAIDTTETPAWGAGVAFADFKPAYKGGWGGGSAAERRFEAAQVVTFSIRGRGVAVVGMFHPDDEPATDDPGASSAPDALQALFEPIARAFERQAGSG